MQMMVGKPVKNHLKKYFLTQWFCIGKKSIFARLKNLDYYP